MDRCCLMGERAVWYERTFDQKHYCHCVILLRTRHGSRKFDIDEAAGLLVRSPTQLKTALGRAPVMSNAKRPLDDVVPAEQMGIKALKSTLDAFGVEYSTPCEKHELVSALNKYRSEQWPTNAAADAAPPTKKAAPPSDGGTGSGVQHDPTEAIDWLHEQSKAALESLRQPNFVEHRKIEERLRGILSALQPRDPGGGSSSSPRKSNWE